LKHGIELNGDGLVFGQRDGLVAFDKTCRLNTERQGAWYQARDLKSTVRVGDR
jgi:hypothetical protein